MQRPYVLVNVASSADGKIDTVARRGATLSSMADKRRVDELRADVDAILVGGRTLIDEDPKLTVRDEMLRQKRLERGLPENPIKVGVVSLAELSLDGDFVTAGPAERLIFTTRRTPPEQIIRLEKAGVQVYVSGENRVDLLEVLSTLYQIGVRRLMVEGGGTILAEFFRLGVVDELTIYIAPKILGGATAPTLADGPGFDETNAPRLHLISVEKVDPAGGILLHYKTDSSVT
jgi:2,5-diamino-6-(ribosylamino)-4(3H)-pyrimidinone 5'-phosphate reductase